MGELLNFGGGYFEDPKTPLLIIQGQNPCIGGSLGILWNIF